MHSFNRNLKLNLYDYEDNVYFLDLIHSFNLNKDHFIVKISHELDEFIDDSFQAFKYIQSNYMQIVDYLCSHPEESVLGLILLDRISRMLPYYADYAETTLAKLKSQVYNTFTSAELDNIAIAGNKCVKDAKEIKKLRDNVNQLKNSLYRIVGGLSIQQGL